MILKSYEHKLKKAMKRERLSLKTLLDLIVIGFFVFGI